MKGPNKKGISPFVVLVRRMILVLATTAAPLMAQQAEGPQEAAYTKEASLDWQAVAGAKSYQTELTITSSDVEKKMPPTITVHNKPQWSAQLSPGEYALRIRTMDNRGVPGPWSDPVTFSVRVPDVTLDEPQAGAQILATSSNQPVVMKWHVVKGITRYNCEILDSSGKSITTEECAAGSWEQTLPAARSYQFRVAGMGADGYRNKDEPAANSFMIIGPKLATPVVDKDTEKGVFWRPSPNARGWHVVIMETKENTTEEKSIVDRTILKPRVSKKRFGKYNNYKLTVIATAPDYQSSDPLVYEIKAQKRPPPPKKKEKVIAQKHPFSWLSHEITYGYVPLMQYYHVNYPEMDSSLSTLYFNSQLLQARAWSGSDRSLVMTLTAKQAKRVIVNYGTTGVADGTDASSPIVTLKLWDVSIDAKKYFLGSGRVRVGGGAGVARKDFYTFREGDPLTVTPIASTVTELLAGGDLIIAVTPEVQFTGDAYYGYHLNATELNVKKSLHYTLGGALSHSTIYPWMLFSYFYRFDLISNTLNYTSAPGTTESITAIVKSYQIGGMITCQF